ncbi:MAG: hypothetical protein AVDCRST_MAG85-3448, partial [uncultured Solirubrobacteraceae bacterium]
ARRPRGGDRADEAGGDGPQGARAPQGPRRPGRDARAGRAARGARGGRRRDRPRRRARRGPLLVPAQRSEDREARDVLPLRVPLRRRRRPRRRGRGGALDPVRGGRADAHLQGRARDGPTGARVPRL